MSHEVMSCQICSGMADEECPVLANLTAQRDELRVCLGGILGILGNVNHSVGHGENSARMRGDMLNAIRGIVRTAFDKTAPPTPCQPDITLSTGRVVRHTRMPNGATDASIVGLKLEMTPEEWEEYCRIIAGNPNAGVVQVSPKGRWTTEEAEEEGLKIMKEQEGTP